MADLSLENNPRYKVQGPPVCKQFIMLVVCFVLVNIAWLKMNAVFRGIFLSDKSNEQYSFIIFFMLICYQ